MLSDASDIGIGIWWNTGFIQINFDDCPYPWNLIKYSDINVREFWAVMVAAITLHDLWVGEVLRFTLDNTTAYAALRNLKCENECIMAGIRFMAAHAIKGTYRWFIHWLKSADNSIADALSRDQWSRFHELTEDRELPEWRIPFHLMDTWMRDEPAWEQELFSHEE